MKSPDTDHGCLIVGASHAGVQLALSLRQQGWADPITLIGEENHLPYHRPPLSKALLAQQKTAEEIRLRPRELFAREKIELLLGYRATAIDRAGKTLSVRDPQGNTQWLNYHKLALCTGSRARQLAIPGNQLAGVHSLRTLADVTAIQHSMASSHKPKAVIVGGGYIGLEAAAALRGLGLPVTLVELAPRLLSRVTSETVAKFFTQYHQLQGVEIITGDSVTSFNGQRQLTGVSLASGRTLDATLAIVGVGIEPHDQLAQQAGLYCNNGLWVDEFAQTDDPSIVAAGDCTNFPHPNYGRIRLESVPNATEQATSAAATLCGQRRPHTSVPWFWSDQYDCKMQMAGLSATADQQIVVGTPLPSPGNKPAFSVFYLQEGILIAVDAINRPKDFMRAKRWIAERHRPDPMAIAALA